MKIVLLEGLNIPDEKVEELAQPLIDQGHDFIYYPKKTTDPNELVKRSEGADIVMIANNPYPTEVIDKNPNLKLINVAFTGFDHVGFQDAKNQDITVTNAAGYANQAVCELTIGLVLDLYRHIHQGHKDTKLAEDFPGPIQGRQISGKTVGIIGTGQIGLQTAKIFQAMGAKVIAYSRSQKSEAIEMGIDYYSLDEVMKQSDIISIHLPLNESTSKIISAEKIALMKEDAILINTARGGVVDNDALAEALEGDRIAGAGIDVYDMEPPIPSDYPLLNAKNTILTPHIGFLTDEAMEKRAEIAFNNTQAFIDGKPQNVVN